MTIDGIEIEMTPGSPVEGALNYAYNKMVSRVKKWSEENKVPLDKIRLMYNHQVFFDPNSEMPTSVMFRYGHFVEGELK
jgi:hypothetical protein